MSEIPTPVEWEEYHAWEEVRYALSCLKDDFDGKGSGPSGLRAAAMAHLQQALLKHETAQRVGVETT